MMVIVTIITVKDLNIAQVMTKLFFLRWMVPGGFTYNSLTIVAHFCLTTPPYFIMKPAPFIIHAKKREMAASS